MFVQLDRFILQRLQPVDLLFQLPIHSKHMNIYPKGKASRSGRQYKRSSPAVSFLNYIRKSSELKYSPRLFYKKKRHQRVQTSERSKFIVITLSSKSKRIMPFEELFLLDGNGKCDINFLQRKEQRFQQYNLSQNGISNLLHLKYTVRKICTIFSIHVMEA